MQFLLRLSRGMDAISEWVGRILIWALLTTVIVSAVNAIVRKVFSVGSNAWLELQWYLFAAVFLLGAGYTFLHNAHVRIDFISGRLSARTRNIIDIVGIVAFLAPFAWILLQLSWPLFVNAWQSGEMSQNAGGLIRWPVLALVPLAIGTGEGSEIRGPMAITIIGGLLASTVGAVFVLPPLYLVLDRLRPGGRRGVAM